MPLIVFDLGKNGKKMANEKLLLCRRRRSSRKIKKVPINWNSLQRLLPPPPALPVVDAKLKVVPCFFGSRAKLVFNCFKIQFDARQGEGKGREASEVESEIADSDMKRQKSQ